MKKIIMPILALIMVMSLVACGGSSGPDKQPAIDAFNQANTAFSETATLINENPDSVDEALRDVFIDMSGLMAQYKDLLESDDEIAQEDLDKMIAWFGQVESWSKDSKAVIEANLAGNSTNTGASGANNANAEISDEQLAALTKAYNEVAPLYNAMYASAEQNGWLNDEQTATEVQALSLTLGFVGEALTNDLSLLNGSDFEALPSSLTDLIPAVKDLTTRVSVPYEG